MTYDYDYQWIAREAAFGSREVVLGLATGSVHVVAYIVMALVFGVGAWFVWASDSSR